MMNSLFSSFDPAMSKMSLNYMIILLPLLLVISNKVTIMNSRWNLNFKSLNQFLENEINTSIPNKNIKGKTTLLLSLFFIILMLNFLSLMPYIFTLTAQMALTLSLALPFWLSFLLFSVMKNTKHFFAHLVPLGTPMALSQFMTLIETVSLMIRPITLSVRLAANMTAGHILMALCSAPIMMLNIFSVTLFMLITLEMAVAIIQAYVFMTLLSMYLSET